MTSSRTRSSISARASVKLCYPNPKDQNVPFIKVTKGGEGRDAFQQEAQRAKRMARLFTLFEVLMCVVLVGGSSEDTSAISATNPIRPGCSAAAPRRAARVLAPAARRVSAAIRSLGAWRRVISGGCAPTQSA